MIPTFDDELPMDALPHIQVGRDVPLFAVHDRFTGAWYVVDADMWEDLVLQAEDDDNDDEFSLQPA